MRCNQEPGPADRQVAGGEKSKDMKAPVRNQKAGRADADEIKLMRKSKKFERDCFLLLIFLGMIAKTPARNGANLKEKKNPPPPPLKPWKTMTVDTSRRKILRTPADRVILSQSSVAIVFLLIHSFR